MPAYKAPLRDIRFLMNEMLDFPAHYQTLASGQNADAETVDMILEGAADYCENVLSPLNQSGDEEGCTFNNSEVTTPKGFKEAYDQFVMGGWQGLSYPEEFGGQGLPMSLNLIKSEMMGTANWSFTMYPGLSTGCMNTIIQFGTDEQKNTYMPKLVEGTWSGTMCLTEPQCGTDLGQVKTKAEPQADGTYKISGTKIFISAGEHDLTENIIHIVLARLPDAPAGTRGISLFIVPKFIPTADGGVGERNTVSCGSIEHKMGIRASATAVLNFDNATGYLIGEGGRAMIYHAAKLADLMADALASGDTAAYEAHDDKLGFYTPILKGFLTELGLEASNNGMQVYGGHGYIKEWGMEQIARDARISTLYEGTTGVQALDLLGRKVLLSSKGKVVRDYTAEILKFCATHARNKHLRRFAWDLTKLCAQWNTLTVRIMLAARKDRDIVSSASNDFLMFSGYVMMAYFWAQQAVVASEKLEAGNGAETPEFYKAKIKVAEFYFDRLLPRAQGHAESMVSTSRTLTSLVPEHFSFDY